MKGKTLKQKSHELTSRQNTLTAPYKEHLQYIIYLY